MFFRNLTFLSFPSSMVWQIGPPPVASHSLVLNGAGYVDGFQPGPTLQEQLAACALKPVGPLETSASGFVSPFGRGETELVHAIGDALWVSVGTERKILPAAVVNDALAARVAEVEAREGRKLGGKARKRLKDDLLHELLPRAFVKTTRTDALLDVAYGFIAVDTPSRKTAEAVASEIRRALGSFPAIPPNAEVAPRGVLTGWVTGEPLPNGLALGDEAQLQDAMDGGAVLKAQHQELLSDEVAKHLEAGKQVVRLALTLDDHLSFVLGEDLVVRKLRFLEGAVDQLESTERDDLRAELDARFALLAGEVRRLYVVLRDALKLSEVAS